MKKIIILSFIFLTITVWAREYGESDKDASDLTYELADRYLNYAKQNNLKTNEFGVSETYATGYGSSAQFSMNLKGGITYIFFTLSNGPKMSACLRNNNGYNVFCNGSSKWLISRCYIKYTGKYYYKVYNNTNDTGIHKSYYGYIETKNKELNYDLQYRWNWFPDMFPDGYDAGPNIYEK